jgi:hypothetical protein
MLLEILANMPAPRSLPGQTPRSSNHFNDWFPPKFTSVNIVAPRWSNEYVHDPATARAMIPLMLAGGWNFPRQVKNLIASLSNVMHAELTEDERRGLRTARAYRRRYWNQYDHMRDDRDIVVVVPRRAGQSVLATLFFDQDQNIDIMRLR